MTDAGCTWPPDVERLRQPPPGCKPPFSSSTSSVDAIKQFSARECNLYPVVALMNLPKLRLPLGGSA
eukprot:4271158-Amphidinium_carterae.1